MTPPLLEVAGLVKHYPVRGGAVRAVDGVSFTLTRGETLSLVGESGCGKSTVGRCILRLAPVTEGQISLAGKRIDDLPERHLRPLRRHMQVVFQDPFSSLNPRQRIRDVIAEPLRNFSLASGAALDARVAELLDQVGLPASAMHRLPHEFSGGQRQRIGIARALAPAPDLLVCDEAVSALDVSVKAQIVNLLLGLQERLGLALLFISHDLAIVEHLTHRVAVMYLGRIVELAPRRALFAAPPPPPTRARCSRPCRRLTRRPREIAPCCAATCRAGSPRPRLPLSHPLPGGLRPLPDGGAGATAGGGGTCRRLPSGRVGRLVASARHASPN